MTPTLRPRRTATASAAVLAAAGLLLGLGGSSSPAAAAPRATAVRVQAADDPWLNTALNADQRAGLLLSQMTLEEKVSRLHGEYSSRAAFFIPPLERLGIPGLLLTDAGAGVRVTDPEVNGGRATALPAPLALGATWDTAQAKAYGDVLGTEVRATGHNGLLGPSGDLVRTPLWGRAFETFGEDPRLSARLLVPEIDAIQSHHVVATVKHAAVYNQELGRLDGGNAEVSTRALREVYLAPFEAAIRQAHVGSVMCSFNKVNGIYACENAEVLTNILKNDFGFQGFVQSDYGATHSTVASAYAGLDVEFPTGVHYGQALLDAVRNGQVSQAVVDDKVRRVLRTMFAFGLFDVPTSVTPLPEDADSAVARTVEERAIVLLKNAGVKGTPALPLDAGSLHSIAVSGPDADTIVSGGGSSLVRPTRSVTALEALRERAGAGVDVTYSPGTDSVGPAHLLPGGAAAVPSSVLAPPDGPLANGLRAEYFTNTALSGRPSTVRNDAQIALSAGFLTTEGLYGSPVPSVPGFGFGGPLSVRWTGTITAPTTGDYTLALTGTGSASLYLDDSLVLDATDPHALRTDRTPTLHLQAGVPHTLRVEYANTATDPSQESGADLLLSWTHPLSAVSPAVATAAAAAAKADVAVVFARDYTTEGRDRSTLTLANEQDALISAVAAANRHTVVVLETGGAVAMPWLARVPAVVEAWYGGQEQGSAIAAVLFGDVNPSGKLPVTFARSERATPASSPEQYPGKAFSAQFTEDVNVGYRGYLAADIAPLFPFGHGLSYTRFAYSRLTTSQNGLPVRDGGSASVRVRVRVKNTGTVAGTETVQAYVGSLPTRLVQTPPKQLAGFAKVTLAPGQTKTVSIDLDPRAFAYWNVGTGTWTTPTGEVALSVGTSSAMENVTGTVTIS